MARCGDCYWFRTQLPAGRDASTCEELGEKLSNPACDRFKDKSSEALAPIVPLERLKLEDPEYKETFMSIFAEIFAMLKDGELASKNVYMLLQQQGVEAELDPTEFQRYQSKLSSLYLLHQLCLTMGLATYTEDVVKAEVQRLFPPKTEVTKK